MKLTLLCTVIIFLMEYHAVNGWRRWGRRRRRRTPVCDCKLSSWTSWCKCSHECGMAGTQSRTRYKTASESGGGRCWPLKEVRSCNRNACQNGGTALYGRCSCRGGWTGTCCEKDICSTNRCQHICTNLGHNYMCSCHSCYTKFGTRCELKKCKIGERCYTYGTVNPGNQCQNCQKHRETAWTNNDALSCSDGNLCTRNDKCVSGVCRGIPFTCKSCERCDGRACMIKTGFCVIGGKCYKNGDVRQGNPCEWCDTKKSTTSWSNRDGFSCDDGESCTKTDTCQDGQCKGVSFTCNAICQYCNGNGCSLHSGYGHESNTCTCKIEGIDYNHQEINPENECQWCDLNDNNTRSSSAWSNKPTSPCNDSNSCTKGDTCENGRCSGTQYSCPSEYPQSSCLERSECVGDGTCNNILKTSGIICRPAIDLCDQAERCEGEVETCPSEDLTAIELRHGEASLTRSDFENNSTFQSNTDQLYVKLSNFYVSCGGLTFKWSLLKSSDACIVADNATTLYSDTDNYILTGLSLQNTETYQVAVQPTDIRSRTGTAVCTNSVTIDTTTPVAGWIVDGLGWNDLEYQSSKVIRATWGGFQTEYGIARYEVAVYDKEMEANEERISVQNFTSVGVEDSFTKTFLTITDGSNVTTVVRAYTKAGLYKEITSNGVIVDTSKPFPGLVSDGPDISSDLQYANWTKTYDVSWEAFTDPHSPIIEYKVGVGSKIDNLATSSLTSVGLKTSFQLSGLSLPSGDKCCAVVEGINAAGLKTQAFSDCVIIDHDAPLPGKVNDGSEDDIDFQSDDTAFQANWDGFYDNYQGSGLAEYRYMLTDQNGNETTQWISVGLQKNVSITGLSFVDGNKYYITVRAIDRAGNYIDVKSDGVLIDRTPPTFTGVIIEGRTAQRNGKTVVYVQDGDSIVAGWPQLIDEHSGVERYQWSIAVEGNENPTQWKDVPGDELATSAVFRSISLIKYQKYRLTIRGINNAGLFTDIRSPVIIFVDKN